MWLRFYVDYDHSYVQASAKAKDVASSELSKSLLQEIMSNGPLLPVTQSGKYTVVWVT